MPNVAMVVSTVGFHWEEVFAAYKEFKNANWAIKIYTVDGAKPKADPVSLRITGPLASVGLGMSRGIAPDTELGKEISAELDRAKPLAELDTNTIDALYLPGGHGCLFDMNKNPLLKAKVEELYAQKKLLSAVCHATSTFAFAEDKGHSIVLGKKLTGFPDAMDDALVKLGAVDRKFLPIPLSNDRELERGGAKLSGWNKFVALMNPTYRRVDLPFITGTGPKAASGTARAVIREFTRSV